MDQILAAVITHRAWPSQMAHQGLSHHGYVEGRLLVRKGIVASLNFTEAGFYTFCS
jgi:hypothetical protein